MNRKQKLIISITGITIVMLALLGLTYGYYLTRIQGNTNSNSISITTSDLKLTYRDGMGELTAQNIMPGNEVSSKTFIVENEGEQDVSAYTVALINIMNNFTFKEDLEVSVSCSSNINSGVCEGFAEDYEDKVYKEKYPATNSELFSLGIKEGETHTFTLKVKYLYQEFDQSDDMGKTLKGKVQIYDPKDTIEVSGEVTGYAEGDYAEIHSDIQTSEIVDGKYKFVGIPADNHTLYIKNRNTSAEKSTTLEIKKGQSESTTNGVITFTNTSKVANVTIDASNTNLSATVNDVSNGTKILVDTIMNDTRITKNTGTPDFSTGADYKVTGDASSGEIGMYSAEDDYGTSWYFRGQQSYNYINFAGFTWRIVRINGDNSVRLILDGTLDDDVNCDDSDSEIKFCDKAIFPNNTDDIYYGSYGSLEYMYGEYLDENNELIKDYSVQSKNLYDSNIKTYVDTFYEKHILNYQNYLADTILCGDKTIIRVGYIEEPLIVESERQTYTLMIENYNYSRFLSDSYSLKCANIDDTYHTEEEKAYSRYTSKFETDITTNKGILINNDLKYPIALLSIDEAVMSGITSWSSENNDMKSYLYLDSSWWTMNQSASGTDEHFYFYIYLNFIDAYGMPESPKSIRPVINLRSDVLIESGNGTESKPYIVKLPS